MGSQRTPGAETIGGCSAQGCDGQFPSGEWALAEVGGRGDLGRACAVNLLQSSEQSPGSTLPASRSAAVTNPTLLCSRHTLCTPPLASDTGTDADCHQACPKRNFPGFLNTSSPQKSPCRPPDRAAFPTLNFHV